MIDIELKTTLEDAEKIAELLESHGEGFGWYAMVLRDQIKDKTEVKVITKSELIELCRGKVFKCESQDEWDLCVEKIENLGINPCSSFNIYDEYKAFMVRKNGNYQFGGANIYNANATAQDFLSLFTPSVTTTKNSTVIDNPNVETKKIKVGNVDVTIEYSEPEKVVYQSHKDYLEALIKKMDANKEIFIETHNKRTGEIHDEMICSYNSEIIAYVDCDGKYRIDKPLTSTQVKVVTKWVNRLEKDMKKVGEG